VEWPERAGDRLRPPDLSLRLDYSAAGREVEVTASTVVGETILAILGLEPA
jgi:tRNA A37 threonylcarbamoyladenosine biosynthesis protein TsaE